MGILDDLGNIVKQAAAGTASPEQVHETYDQVSRAVPQSSLADAIGHAFRSDQTPPFGQMVSGMFGQSNPDQKAGLLNQLLAALGQGGAAQALAGQGMGALAGLVPGSVTPQQAQAVPPEAVEALATQAAKKDPTIMDQAAAFYAQHPTLVKAIGIGALALLLSKITSR